ncbi:MAG: efflux RND transporter periplasmic adaptor subunit [Pseudomonadota bacterium]
MTRYRLLLVLLVVAAIAGGIFLFAWSRPVTVASVAVTRGDAVELVYATGFVEPRHPVTVAARITAPVARVLVREGDHVRAGQPLVMLDDGEQRMLLAAAAASSVQANLAERRALTLYSEGWVTRANREQAVATAAAARARLDQMVVRAGIAGIVLTRDVQPGDLATPGNVLLRLGNPDDIWITATVDERDVPRLQVGQPTLIKSDAWPGRVITGRLDELTPGGDPTLRAFRARIGLDRATALPIGMTVEINVVTHREPQALLLPSTAVVDGHVWLIVAGRAHRAAVRVGIAGAERTQILAGLAAGDRVVASPGDDLREGARVVTAGG